MLTALKSTPLVYFDYSKAKGEMKAMIHESANNPDLRALAIDLIRQAQSAIDEAHFLFKFVRSIRYTGDVFGEDIYQDPLLTVKLQAGDCNNKVVLGCALAKSVGFPTRMVFVFNYPEGERGINGEDFPYHVFYQVDENKGDGNPRWINCETIPAPPEGKFLDFGQSVKEGWPDYVEVDQ